MGQNDFFLHVNMLASVTLVQPHTYPICRPAYANVSQRNYGFFFYIVEIGRVSRVVATKARERERERPGKNSLSNIRCSA